MQRPRWKVSLHSGHSSDYCDHAHSTLREMLHAATDAGYHTFGVTEHIPRGEVRFLYAKELQLGWDLEKVEKDFVRYTADLTPLAREFSRNMVVLRGFEAEIVPFATHRDRVTNARAVTLSDGSLAFDYFVGSVHYVDEISIDGELELFQEAAARWRSPIDFAVAYYGTVENMIRNLHPDVVGHIDLIKLNWQKAGFDPEILSSSYVMAAAGLAIDAAKEIGAILDLNTAGYRKGLGEPYAAPWIVKMAQERGVYFCFGDDSHKVEQVGFGIEKAREYLLENGVSEVSVLTKVGGFDSPMVKQQVSLT